MSFISSNRVLSTVFVFLITCSFFPAVRAQSPIDLSVHVSPHLRYVDSRDFDNLPEPGSTSGNNGIALGYNIGAAVEYRFFDEFYVRAGIDYAHKRHRYSVDRLGNDIRPASSGQNTVTYRALEVPVQLIYRFGFRDYKNNFMVGAGVVAAKFVGDPKVSSSFSNGDLTGFESLVTEGTNWSVFAGYDHYLNRSLMVSFEPYLAFSPDRIYLESNTYTRVVAEGGIRLRITRDN